MVKKGRPTRDPTGAERQKVRELAAESAPISDIAKLLKRSVPNLRKYFRTELESGKKLAGKKAAAGKIKPTRALREKVARYIGCKMHPRDVARVIGCKDEDELKEIFPEEVVTGQARYRARVLDHLDEQMRDGAIGATNRLEAITVIPDPGEAAAVRPGPNLGKKAAERADAALAGTLGGKFAPRPAPRLAVDNTSS